MRGHLEQNGQKLVAPTIHGNWDKTVLARLADGSERQLFVVNEVPEKRCVYCSVLPWQQHWLERERYSVMLS